MKAFRKFPGGFSLVELTIATALFSLGMGSLSLLYLLSVQGALEAQLRTSAVTTANSLSEMAMVAPDARERFIHPGTAFETDCGQANAQFNSTFFSSGLHK